jgi:hypothetical protein
MIFYNKSQTTISISIFQLGNSNRINCIDWSINIAKYELDVTTARRMLLIIGQGGGK